MEITVVRMIVDIALKSAQKETVRILFKCFLEISSIMALILLISNKGGITNLEKSMELCGIISVTRKFYDWKN